MNKLITILILLLISLITLGQTNIVKKYPDQKIWKNTKDNIIAVYQYKPDKNNSNSIERYTNANFKFAEFNEVINFERAEFYDVINFVGSKFNAVSYFSSTKFNSPVYFYSAKINNVINFENAEFNDVTSFNNTQFDSLAYFRLTKFKDATYFQFVKFSEAAYFYGVELGSLTNFTKTIFDDEAVFEGSQFHSIANFNESNFKAESGFTNSQFGSLVFFKKTKFSGEAVFEGSQFDSLVYFNEAKFSGIANFINARFDFTVNFDRVEFHDVADFYNTKFGTKAIFSKAKFKRGVLFNNASMPDTIYFDYVTDIAKEIDFTAKKENSRVCYINLTKSNIDKIKLTYGPFKLFFASKTPMEDRRNVYENLLNKLKKDGSTESYKLLDIEYNGFKYSSKQTWKSYWIAINWLEKKWWNYGYNKEFIFRNTLVILMFFIIINLILFNFLNQKVYKIEKIWEKYITGKKVLPVTEKFDWEYNIYRLPASIFYTCLIFFGLKMSYEKVEYNSWWGTFYLYLQYLIGLLCLAYVVNFIFENQEISLG